MSSLDPTVSDVSEPSHGTVYTIRGRPNLYVRTEVRKQGGGPEHLFIRVDRNMIFQHWTADVPPEAELIMDADGRQQAEQEKWLRAAAEHNIEIVFGLLKQACDWLPAERAKELRRRYTEAQPSKDA